MANRIIRNEEVAKKPKSKAGKEKATKKKTAAVKKERKRREFSMEWIHNRNFQIVVGAFLIFFSVFLFAAFCSFFTTHAEDVTTASRNLFTTIENGKTTSQVGNSLGIIGLYFSFLFIKFGFGIASFGFLLLFILWGIYLISKKALLPLFKSFMATCFSIVWVSLLFGWIFGKNSRTDWLGGDIGNALSQFLIDTAIGHIGFLLLMIFLAIVILFIFFGMTFSNIIPVKGEKEEKKESTENGTEAKISVPENPFKGPKHIDHSYPPVSEPTEEPEQQTRIEVQTLEKVETGTPETPVTTTEAPAVLDSSKDKLMEEPEAEDVDWIDTEEETSVEPEVEPEDTQEDGTASESLTEETAPGNAKSSIEAFKAQGMSDEEATDAYLATLPPLDPRDELIHYEFPTPDLLEAYTNAARSIEERELEIQNNKIRIQKILSNFGVEIQSITATEGPTVTMYEIIPAPGVRINKIKNLEDDIALSVAAIGIRIIAPIPGKGSVGIEVPNSKPKIVPMRDMVTSDKFLNAKKMALPIAIGRTISNEVFVFDLAKMPHVLMAGATGQGKSVGLNAVLTSLLYYKHPSELKLVLVDPKKVELTLYSKIERHYLAKLPDTADAIITDTKQVVRTLNSLCIEMDNRYELLKKALCRNIIEYNDKYKSRHLNPDHGHRFLPYIVVIFDEFADCIMTAGREVESPVARLAQLARAVGIHLIVATQRPSVNIITGVIKANFPARIAFRVSSSVDSRTILDTSGAERLIGKGDMLISTGSEITRLQCALVDTPEIERICEFIGEQHGFTHAFLLPEVPEDTEDNTQTSDDGEIDSCFAEAARIVVQTGHGSTSLLQRKLKLGYNRAGRVMDQLEREGIVGAFEGSKARDVIIRDINVLEEKLKNMGLA